MSSFLCPHCGAALRVEAVEPAEYPRPTARRGRRQSFRDDRYPNQGTNWTVNEAVQLRTLVHAAGRDPVDWDGVGLALGRTPKAAQEHYYKLARDEGTK